MPQSDQTQAETTIRHCATCKCAVTSYAMCDRAEGDLVWCLDCFAETECGNGWHGEGCPTNVFEDGAAPSPVVHWRCFHCDATPIIGHLG